MSAGHSTDFTQVLQQVNTEVEVAAQENRELSAKVDDIELKRKYAEALLRNPNQPYLAALEAFDHNVQLATFACFNWAKDPEFIRLKRSLIAENGKEHYLPDREDFARMVIDRAENEPDTNAAAKLLNIYADVRGFSKPESAANGPQVIINNVMEIPHFTSDADFEAVAAAQQVKLKQVASKIVDADKVETK